MLRRAITVTRSPEYQSRLVAANAKKRYDGSAHVAPLPACQCHAITGWNTEQNWIWSPYCQYQAEGSHAGILQCQEQPQQSLPPKRATLPRADGADDTVGQSPVMHRRGKSAVQSPVPSLPSHCKKGQQKTGCKAKVADTLRMQQPTCSIPLHRKIMACH